MGDSATSQALLDEGLAALKSGDHADGLRLLMLARDEDPRNETAHRVASGLLLGAQRYDEAFRSLLTAVHLRIHQAACDEKYRSYVAALTAVNLHVPQTVLEAANLDDNAEVVPCPAICEWSGTLVRGLTIGNGDIAKACAASPAFKLLASLEVAATNAGVAYCGMVEGLACSKDVPARMLRLYERGMLRDEAEWRPLPKCRPTLCIPVLGLFILARNLDMAVTDAGQIGCMYLADTWRVKTLAGGAESLAEGRKCLRDGETYANIEMAKAFFAEAWQQGDPEGHVHLAFLLCRGEDVEDDALPVGSRETRSVQANAGAVTQRDLPSALHCLRAAQDRGVDDVWPLLDLVRRAMLRRQPMSEGGAQKAPVPQNVRECDNTTRRIMLDSDPSEGLGLFMAMRRPANA